MTRFVTLTLNPALDIATSVEQVVEAHKLRCAAPRVHPGGGGINVARVLRRFGQDVLAVATAGGPTGERLGALLAAEQVPAAWVSIAGETRESFTVCESSTEREFRFVLPGPSLSTAEWQGCLERIARLPSPAYLVASGSLPPGVPDDFYARLARLARQRGSRLVLDASGPPLQAALAEGVWAVKPSLRELREVTGQPLDTLPGQLQAARDLVASGRAQVIGLSLGPYGALMVSAATAVSAPALHVPVAGTVGAGDSFLAGWLAAWEAGESLQEVLRTAVAAASAALLSPGTSLCDPTRVAALRGQVVVETHL